MLLDQRRSLDPVAGEQAQRAGTSAPAGSCRRNRPRRLPVNAAFGGAAVPRLIFACGGLRITPVTVARRLTISARSSGAEVP